MWKEGSQIVYFLLKTHHYSNKQLIVHGKVDHNILVMKNEIVCKSICIKGDVTWILHQKNMKYDHNMFYKKVFLWQMMLSLTFLLCD